MAKRKPKITKGKYKAELRNLPIKGLINKHHQQIINQQLAEQNISQSEYLRNLLLNQNQVKRKRAAKNHNLIDSIVNIGRKLNQVAHNTNTSLLSGDTIQIDSNAEIIFKEIEQKLDAVLDEAKELINEKNNKNNIQIKILVTPSELEIIEKITKNKKITKCRYLRKQITGYQEIRRKSQAQILSGQIGKLSNNINQIQKVIASQEQNKKLVIITSETKLKLRYIQEQINNILNILKDK